MQRIQPKKRAHNLRQKNVLEQFFRNLKDRTKRFYDNFTQPSRLVHGFNIIPKNSRLYIATFNRRHNFLDSCFAYSSN